MIFALFCILTTSFYGIPIAQIINHRKRSHACAQHSFISRLDLCEAVLEGKKAPIMELKLV